MYINSIVMEIEQDSLYIHFLRSRELKSVSIDRYNSGPNILTEISHDQDVDGRPEDIVPAASTGGTF